MGNYFASNVLVGEPRKVLTRRSGVPFFSSGQNGVGVSTPKQPRAPALSRLDCSAAAEEVGDDRDDRQNQQQVNQSTRHVKSRESDEPDNQQNEK
jgi:hypothetical protein